VIRHANLSGRLATSVVVLIAIGVGVVNAVGGIFLFAPFAALLLFFALFASIAHGKTSYRRVTRTPLPEPSLKLTSRALICAGG